MKSGKNNLRQLIESTINAWCCCDTPTNDKIAELERKYRTLLGCFKEASEECAELRQEILGHELNDKINLKNLKNEAALLSAALIKVTAIDDIYRLLDAENDSAYKLLMNKEMWLTITTTVSIFCGIAAIWGWLVIFGVVPI